MLKRKAHIALHGNEKSLNVLRVGNRTIGRNSCILFWRLTELEVSSFFPQTVQDEHDVYANPLCESLDGGLFI